MAEIKYEVVQRIAVLSQRPRGWERQLNLISWNDGEPKYDIRDWSPDGTRMGKGISLSHDEMALPMRVPSGDQSRMSYLGSPSFQLMRFS